MDKLLLCHWESQDMQIPLENMQVHLLTTFSSKAKHNYDRIDVTFDRYRDVSIKAGTRENCTKKSRPIRRLIEDNDVPLPNKWSDFLASTDNKKDLCLFLSNALDHSCCTK
jgi:hypothetical protein